jgi:phospholipid/cholesterol/gamma-HCH transport system ATP-binding protein
MIEFRNVFYSVPNRSREEEEREDDGDSEGLDEEAPFQERPVQERPGSADPQPQTAQADGREGAALQRRSDERGRLKEARSVALSDAPEGRRWILRDVSFTLADRSITCIMGVSGQGKTTLLRLMAGLLKPDKGEILVDGKDIARLSEKQMNEVRRDMGFVFQYGALFDSLSVAENVGFALEQARRPRAEIVEVVRERLREVGLPEESVLRKLPSEISGGMRKRVAMARALAPDPRIVLYDEPTSGLDPVMARVIDDLIVQLRDRSGTTNVVVSHHLPSILRISDRVLMLYDAQIEVDGTPREVQESPSAVVQQFLRGEAHGPITVA